MEIRKVTVCLGLLIVVFCTPFSYAGGKNIGMPNPAAFYCEAHGYQYEIVKTEKGEFGICKFPDGNKCSAWEFLVGKCGDEYTYCEKIGGKLIIVRDKRCWYSPECAVCKFPDGTEEEVLELMKFKGGKTLKLNTK